MSRDTLKMLHDAKKNEEPTVDGWPLHSGIPQPKPEQVKYNVNGATVYIKPPLYTAPPSCKTCKRCQTEAS